LNGLNRRIDRNKLENLRNAPLPEPIHAVNYIEFQNARYYRLYGLLLAPYALPKGAKPIWVGLKTEDFVGKSVENEIVILEYPNHNVLIDIFTSKFYNMINGLRERGIKRLGFAMCKKERGAKKIGKGNHMIIRFNRKNASRGITLRDFDRITKKYFEIEYVASEYGFLDIFKEVEETDPREVEFKNISIVSGNINNIEESMEQYQMDMKNGHYDISIQQFRSLGVAESMPWSKVH
jgi:uncharacterized protein (DUF1330 family)